MKYDEPIISRIQQANDIVEVVSGYIPLKKSGSNFKACCPFHQEKTPSFTVSQEKQIFHCFGCGAGGDVFSFVMKHDNLNFPEAVKQLAEKAGIALPENDRPGSGSGEKSSAGKFLEIHALALEHYQKNLEHPKFGLAARTYLESRGFPVEEMRVFGVGYALPDWETLHQYLTSKGFSEDLLLRSGVIAKSARGTLYDRMRGRLVFPIYNARGKVVAFGGRALTPEMEPKYLNSPESEIFQKRKEFFGLNNAKRFITDENPRIYITEGYLDQIRMAVCGFKNTVATLGTALTDDHVRTIKRYAQEAVLLYDGDKAGQAAAMRGLEIFLKEGMVVKVLVLPQGQDPDDYLRQHGAEAFRQLADKPLDFFDFKMDYLRQRFQVEDSLGTVRITNEFLDTLENVQEPALLERYIGRLSREMNLHEESLRQELTKRKQGQGKTRTADPVSSTGTVKKETVYRDETALLAMLAANNGLADFAFANMSGTELVSLSSRRLFDWMRERYSAGESFRPVHLTELIEGDYRTAFAEECFKYSAENATVKHLTQCLYSIKERHRKQAVETLVGKIGQAEARGSQAEAEEYKQRVQEENQRFRDFLAAIK